MWIRKPRIKTNNMCNIPLLRVPRELLQKYSTDKGCELRGQVLPVPTNQKMNAYLKEVADICGINKRLTTHVARHTFATLQIALGTDIYTVSKMLTHKNVSTTQIYADLVSSKKRESANKISLK